MKHCLVVILIATFQLSIAQSVGIGTTTPNSSALLHIDLGASTTKGFLVTGNYNASSTVPDLGSGSRMMFYPGKAAFRAGYMSAYLWDNSYVGLLSTAMGNNPTASGNSSTALGAFTIASGQYSTALGYNNTASGAYSTAMGGSSYATGQYSTAMGYNGNANGDYTTAIGYITTASGNQSTAIGSKVNTNGHKGAFALGDSDPNNEGTTFSGYPDEFVARFWNGYYFMTSGNSSRSGVYIGHYGNAWLSICDKNLKENFQPLNGEDVLQKISQIRFTSWNYKKQDSKMYRHYGIMAQDFYKAFGHDKYGTIGNDTTVNPIDMIGVDMTAIQALEKRTTDLKNENAELQKQNDSLKESVSQLQKKFEDQQKLITQILEQTQQKIKTEIVRLK